MLAWSIGLRRGERLGLRGQDGDLPAAVLPVCQALARVTTTTPPVAGARTQLVFQAPKTPGARRTVPLPLELGESPRTVQTILGQSSVTITLDLYSHVSLELEQKAASKWNPTWQGQG
jgi:integrase